MPYGNHGIYDQSYLSPLGNQYYETSIIKPKNVFTGVNNRYQQLGDVSTWQPKKVNPDKFKVYEPLEKKIKQGLVGSSAAEPRGSAVIKPQENSNSAESTEKLFGMEFKLLFIIMCFVVLVMLWYIDHLRQKINFLHLKSLITGSDGRQ